MKNKTKKILSFYCLLILFSVWLFCVLPKNPKYSLTVNNKIIPLIVLDTPSERSKGLSGRGSLVKDAGMLFVFDKPGKYGFWMKDMKFSIDIVWINEEKEIVHIEKSVSPASFPKTFFPPENSLYVIEFSTGFVDENNIAVGNILNIVKK